MEPNLEKTINMRIRRTIENLGKNGITATYAPGAVEAAALLRTLLVPGETIAVGGSVTLDQIGALQILRDPAYNFIDRYEKGISREELSERYHRGLSADTFITSSNAITETGLLYNVDGRGSRAAALVYGPRRVIVIAGYNKIVGTIEDAVRRVKTVCAPANAMRLGMDTYCAKHGHCINMNIDRSNCMFPGTGSCDSRLCVSAVVTGKQPEGRMTVIIVGQQLGY